jgi:hypothetical protein
MRGLVGRGAARVVGDVPLDLRDLVDDDVGAGPGHDPLDPEVLVPGHNCKTVVLLTNVLVLRESHPHACVAPAIAALAEKLIGLVVRRPRYVGTLVHLRDPLVHLAMKGLVPGLPRRPLHEAQFTPRSPSRAAPPPVSTTSP